MTNSTTCFAFFVMLLLGVTDAVAQRTARVVDSYDSVWSAGSEGGEWSVDATGEILFADIVHRRSASAASAIRVPGGLQTLPGERCLLCGLDSSGGGVVELWAFAAPASLTLQSTRLDATADYVGVVFDSQSSKIYLLDAAGHNLNVGSWDGLSALSTVTLGVLASAAEVPELASADDLTLVPLESNAVGLVSWTGRPAGRKISIGAQAITVTPWTASSGPTHGAYVVPVETSEGSTLLQVKAVSGAVFDIVRLSDGAVVGSGVGQGPQTPVTVSTTSPLLLGERYAARLQGEAVPTNFAFECVRRYGVSDTLSDGTTMRPFFFQRGASVGHIFNVQLLLNAPFRPVDTRYEGYLLVAFRAPTDPVVQIGQNYLLSPVLIAPVEGWVQADCHQGSISIDVPIPLGLEGLVFLVQYWLVDGTSFKFSQIYGSAIKPM
jgi:hypothetical protein